MIEVLVHSSGRQYVTLLSMKLSAAPVNTAEFHVGAPHEGFLLWTMSSLDNISLTNVHIFTYYYLHVGSQFDNK